MIQIIFENQFLHAVAKQTSSAVATWAVFRSEYSIQAPKCVFVGQHFPRWSLVSYKETSREISCNLSNISLCQILIKVGKTLFFFFVGNICFSIFGIVMHSGWLFIIRLSDLRVILKMLISWLLKAPLNLFFC